jgi:hypothetical protein
MHDEHDMQYPLSAIRGIFFLHRTGGLAPSDAGHFSHCVV